MNNIQYFSFAFLFITHNSLCLSSLPIRALVSNQTNYKIQFTIHKKGILWGEWTFIRTTEPHKKMLIKIPNNSDYISLKIMTGPFQNLGARVEFTSGNEIYYGDIILAQDENGLPTARAVAHNSSGYLEITSVSHWPEEEERARQISAQYSSE